MVAKPPRGSRAVYSRASAPLCLISLLLLPHTHTHTRRTRAFNTSTLPLRPCITPSIWSRALFLSPFFFVPPPQGPSLPPPFKTLFSPVFCDIKTTTCITRLCQLRRRCWTKLTERGADGQFVVAYRGISEREFLFFCAFLASRTLT